MMIFRDMLWTSSFETALKFCDNWLKSYPNSIMLKRIRAEVLVDGYVIDNYTKEGSFNMLAQAYSANNNEPMATKCGQNMNASRSKRRDCMIPVKGCKFNKSKRIRDASIYTSKKYRSSFYS